MLNTELKTEYIIYLRVRLRPTYNFYFLFSQLHRSLLGSWLTVGAATAATLASR
jgi:hypothetical protein